MEYNIKCNGENYVNFLFYPSLNLVAHTSNLVGILIGGVGCQQYTQRREPKALDALGDYKKLDSFLFYQSCQTLGLNRISEVERAINIIKAMDNSSFLDCPNFSFNEFSELLEKSYQCFYKNYWRENQERLEYMTKRMVQEKDWKKMLNVMEESVGSKMLCDFFVFLVEAAAGSATMIPPNISIGAPIPRYDSGFVHEGLHLLIALAGDQYKEVFDFANSHEWKKVNEEKLPYNNWRGKIEQAVVITLDSLINKRPEYLDGCLVGDLRDNIYSEIKQWFEENRKIPLHKFLLEILKQYEKEIFN
ncbi:hypothetical protein KY342_06750 [Candidatus Woesearchaeota archaeon]|nr:hypothetical protein [Candidatus Woesearchaeota archaeon]